MKSCLVWWCHNFAGCKTDLHFFKLTKERYESWMKAIGRDPVAEPDLSNENVICSEHFMADDLVVINKKVHLKPSACPSAKRIKVVKPRKQLRFEDGSVSGEHSMLSRNETAELETIYEESDLEPVAGCSTSRGNEELTVNQEDAETSSTTSTDSHGLWAQRKGKGQVILQSRSNKRKLTVIKSSTEDSEGLRGTPKKTRRLIRTFHNYVQSPRKLSQTVATLKVEKKELTEAVKTQKKQVKRLKKRVTDLNDVIKEVRKKHLATDQAVEMLEKAKAYAPAELLKRLLGNIRRGKVTREQFPEQLRSFALTLQFYSSKAYDYVRRTFQLALPSPSVIRSWMSNVNCTPGISESVLQTLKAKVAEDVNSGRPTLCCVMLDEMAIKKQLEFKHGKTWGYVDIGSDIVDDTLPCATEALVLMIVSLNSHWKIPVAYYLINSLSSEEKANVVKQVLFHLDELGIITPASTCDGPAAHFRMAELLGADFSDIEHIRPFFKHPSANYNVYIIFDICHMVKLWRNNWATLRNIMDGNGDIISFTYIEKLSELQDEEGFRFGTKLRKAHMQWQKQKMKVVLATQTLSSSVADALEFLMKDIRHPFFVNAGPTINFIRIIDRLFDLCNSRNPFAKGCKAPLRPEKEHFWRPILENGLQYLKTLKNANGVPLHLTKNKTPVKGLIISVLSLLGLYDEYVKTDLLQYLLTYKVSQDHLELFFLNIRSRNGWNNNPTAYQIFYTYRRLLIVHDLKKLEGNCISQDETTVLTVTKRNMRKVQEPISVDDVSIMKKYNIVTDSVVEDDVLHEHDYSLFSVGQLLRDNTVCYIGGFVVRSIMKKNHCVICTAELQTSRPDSLDDSMYMLIKRKTRGGLLYPSNGVLRICRETERSIRRVMAANDDRMPSEKHFFSTFVNSVYRNVWHYDCFPALNEHLFDTTPGVENHISKLTKAIIETYANIRFHSIVKKQTEIERGTLIRKQLSKLILFKHQ